MDLICLATRDIINQMTASEWKTQMSELQAHVKHLEKVWSYGWTRRLQVVENYAWISSPPVHPLS